MRLVLALVLPFALLLCSCKTNKPLMPQGAARTWGVADSVRTQTYHGMAYRKIRDDLFDRGHMTRISITLLALDGITKPNMEALLRKYYDEAAARRGFRYRDRASHIDVAVYLSEELIESNMGQWIGAIYKTPADSVPVLRFDDVQFAELHAPRVERFGLTDEQRRLIFRKLMLDRDPEPLPVENLRPAADSLIRRFNLSAAQLDSIAAEGLARHWPYPPMQINR